MADFLFEHFLSILVSPGLQGFLLRNLLIALQEFPYMRWFFVFEVHFLLLTVLLYLVNLQCVEGVTYELASCTWMSISLLRVGTYSAIFHYIHFLSSLYLSSVTCKMWILFHPLMFHNLYKLSSPFSKFFSFSLLTI